jgi:hypothetical protein
MSQWCPAHVDFLRWLSVIDQNSAGATWMQCCFLPSAGSDVPRCLSVGAHPADICAAHHAGPAHSSSGTIRILGFNLLKISFKFRICDCQEGKPSVLHSLLCGKVSCPHSSLRTSLQCPPPTNFSQLGGHSDVILSSHLHDVTTAGLYTI